IKLPVIVETIIQRNNSHVIAGNEKRIFFFVIKRKTKNTVEVIKEIRAFFLIHCQNYFTIRIGFERIIRKLISEFVVIINFAVYGQTNLLLFPNRGCFPELGSTIANRSCDKIAFSPV